MSEIRLREMISMAARRFRCLFLCLFLFCANLSFLPAGSAEAVNSGRKTIASLYDLAGSDIAVQTGMICDILTQQRIADARI